MEATVKTSIISWGCVGSIEIYLGPDKTIYTVKSVISVHVKRSPKIDFQDGLLLNAGQKQMQNAPREHFA